MTDAKGDPQPGRTRADISIGRYPVSATDLAGVYATFAAGGVRHDRHFVQSAHAADGRVLWQAAPRAERVLDQRVAADVSAVLSASVDRDNRPDRPAAGKSGTQQWGDSADNQDAWMAGYTPELAAVVWIGKAVPGPIRDAAGEPIEGHTLPGRLWRDFVRDALTGEPASPLPPPARTGRTDVGDAGRIRKAPTKAPTGFEPVVHTAGSGKRLALTFDDGPSEHTGQVLDLLAEHHVKAVFCVVGEQVDQYPQLLRRIVEQGHGLCNHSTKHDDLGGLSAEGARADIAATDAAIARAAPGVTVPWFRAPYGNFGTSAEVAAGLGHTPLGWLVDPDDWLMPGAATIAERIREGLTPRAVVLVHDGGGDRSQTVEALTTLIPRLLDEGWTFDLPAVTQKAKPLPSTSPTPTPTPTPTLTPTPVQPSVSASPSLSTSSTNHSSSCRTTRSKPSKERAPCTLKPS
jgi:peptidoglycan/xylan/chitin deacetylase (PgdA/CDA1 family)